MRREVQHWNQVRALLEVVIAGAGQTGLSPSAIIRRRSDGLWLQNDGTTWDSSPDELAMTPVDAVNLPGVYQYAVNSGGLTYADGGEGYTVRVSESTNDLLEYIEITTAKSEWDELVSDHVTGSTMGLTLQVVRGLVQGEHRLQNTTYDGDGRLQTADIVIYPTSNDALNDTNALATFSVTCTYNAYGDLTSLISRS